MKPRVMKNAIYSEYIIKTPKQAVCYLILKDGFALPKDQLPIEVILKLI